MKFNPGDKVYVLYDYTLESATVVSARGEKTVLVEFDYPAGYRMRAKREKVAAPNESIAVVWERWKGVNGRGGYRLEREMYADKQTLAKDWHWKGYLWENELGILDKHWTP